jgi:hypothetical protein
MFEKEETGLSALALALAFRYVDDRVIMGIGDWDIHSHSYFAGLWLLWLY